MDKKNYIRVICFLLSLIMLSGGMPWAVFAEEYSASADSIAEESFEKETGETEDEKLSSASSTSISGTYEEITDTVTISYSLGTIWKRASNARQNNVKNATAIRIVTNSESYSFFYRVKNNNTGWQTRVKSTEAECYSGDLQNGISNIAIELYEGLNPSSRKYIVMYRAEVAGEWLSWVSNGNAGVVQKIQSEFGLDGELEQNSDNAGWQSRGNIDSLEIRVYKKLSETGDDEYVRQFEEITDFTKEYCVGNKDNWNTLYPNVTETQIDGVRLFTESKDYYFKYNTVNVGKGRLPSVLSTDKNEYAGWYGYAMTNLSIEVYADGGRVFDDYVVMYRAKVAGNWLDWVSNGNVNAMQTIQYEFNLDGSLDLSSTNAGYSERGNIQALDIRMYKRVSTGDISSSSGTFDETTASVLTMKYRRDGVWDTLTPSSDLGGVTDSVLLHTEGEPYVLKYRTRNVGKDWLSFVNSTDRGASDFAGWKGYPISNIEIRVYENDVRIYDNYVVMYRAKVAGEWLDWVSNASPAVMRNIHSAYNLSGSIDTGATDAGWATRGNIEALEIRVFERRGYGAVPSENAVIIDAPYINQNAVGLPNGCESVSTVMALQYFGIAISPEQFVTKYLDRGAAPSGGRGSDPDKVYVGDPHKTGGLGWGCNAPVIGKALNKILDKKNLTFQTRYNTALSDLCSEYIDKNVPVILWATVKMTENFKYSYWTTDEGKQVKYNTKLHCLLLIGYDENNYFFNDPLEKKCMGYSKESVEKAYKELGSQAIIITNKDDGGLGTENRPGLSESPEIPEEPSGTVDNSKEISKRDPITDEYVQDPIDLSCGAHVIDHTLMTVYGAKTISFNINYRSDLKTCGELGVGWSSNFEKSLKEENGIIKVYDSPSYYAVYTEKETESGVFETETVTKENYTLTKTADGYTVNCNFMSYEYYDDDGRLCKITDKNGISALIKYQSGNTVKIIDEISGRFMTVEKNENGKIVKITDNTGRSSALNYSGDYLTLINDENGHIITYRYNENGYIERGIDNTGTVFFVDAYDSKGRIISQSDAVSTGVSTVINYDEVTEPGYTLVTVSDRTMSKSVYKYNEARRLVSKTEPDGVVTKYEYDLCGRLTKKTDGLSNSSKCGYDERGNLLLSEDKLGRKTAYTYDLRNNLIQTKYPDGSTVSFTYDEKDRLVSSSDLRGVVTSYLYNSDNLLVKKTYSDRSISYEYVKGQVSSVTDARGEKTINTYSEAGFLSSVTDAGGNTVSYTYDNKGNALTVTDAEGNVSSNEYDSNGNVIKTTDKNGNTVTYTYNGNMKVTSMTLPSGARISYEYDAEDRLTKTVYPDGTYTENRYDSCGRTVSVKDRSEGEIFYEYDAVGNLVKTTNTKGGVTLCEYNAVGELTKSTVITEYYSGDDFYGTGDEIEPAGYTQSVTSYEYDSLGRLIKQTNPMGGETKYSYNSAGDLLTVTDPLENKTVNTYDSFGNMISVCDPMENITSYTYDKSGNLLTVKNALGQITTNTYDAQGRLVSTKDPGGHTVTYEYDSLGRVISCANGRGNTTRQYYDPVGNVVKITDASGNADFKAEYDENGRAVKVTDSAGGVTFNDYDWSGNLLHQIDAAGFTSSYSYNAAGQMISAVDRMGGVSYAEYDSAGNLTSLRGPGGSEKRYMYDSAGKLIRDSAVSGDFSGYTYNAAGLKTKLMKASWAETEYTYDAAGRITSFNDGNGTAYYTYDANGNVLSASDSMGTVRREYDALNRVTKYTDTIGNTVEYKYDVCGNLCEMKYPNGECAVYAYDEAHNMTKSTFIDGETSLESLYSYNADEQLIREEKPDGSVLTKTYDTAGRLAVICDLDKNGNVIVNDSYTYDILGRITSESCAASDSKYVMVYDALGRLTKRTEYSLSETETVKNTEEFAYDAAGNIISENCPDGTVNSYTYDENNCLDNVTVTDASSISKNYSYWTNYNGNMMQYYADGKKMDLSYDARDRLKQVNGDNNEYLYDVENNRFNMYYYHTNMQYTYDSSGGRNRLVWTRDDNYTVTVYAYGAEGLLFSKSGDEYEFYHYDYRGSVVAVTDKDGNITDTVKYTVYGSVSEHTGTSSLIFGYNGRDGVMTDPNGLLYMRTRYYDPEIKRFISSDVIDGTISDSTTLNLFAYVNGNPVSFVDPFGLSAQRGENTIGLTAKEIGGKIYYDYTNVVTERINEVLPDFKSHFIYTLEEYISQNTIYWGPFILRMPGYDDYIAYFLGNLYFFYNQVNHNAPWDIKRDDPWRQQFGELRMPYYCGDSTQDEKFLFRGELVTREQLGNITYGYLGSAMGIGEITLFWGGGVAAKGFSQIFSSELSNPEKNYGDSSEDHEAIKKGIDWFYEDYPNSKPGINEILFP